MAPLWRVEMSDAPMAMAFNANGTLLAVGGGDGEILIVDSSTGAIVERWGGHACGTLDLDWSATTGTLASVGQDGYVRFWKLGHDAAVAAEPASPVDPAADARRVMRPWAERVRWSRDGAVCATAAGPHATLWRADGTVLRRFPPAASTISDLTWLPGRERFSTVCYGGATVWHRDREEPERQLVWKGSFLCHAWSPNERWMVAGMQESAVHVFEVRAGKDFEMSGYRLKVRRVAFSDDGRRMATTGGVYTTVWSFAGSGPAGTTPVSLSGHALPVSDVAFFRAGLWLATVGEDGQVLIWDLNVSAKTAEGAGFVPSPASRVLWHPVERRVISAHQSGQVVAWPAMR
jgi:WD40 repeat protein